MRSLFTDSIYAVAAMVFIFAATVVLVAYAHLVVWLWEYLG